MSINAYKQTQNATDTPVQLSARAIRSVLLYCKDWSDKSLSLAQRKKSLSAGQLLCDALIMNLNETLPEIEYRLLMTILRKTSNDIMECNMQGQGSLVEDERAMIRILDILENKKSIK